MHTCKPFTSVSALLEHLRGDLGFNFERVIYSKCGWGDTIDEVQIIKLVNFIRAYIRENGAGECSMECLIKALMTELECDSYLNDIYMMPTIPDDALMFLLCEYVQSSVYNFDNVSVVPSMESTTDENIALSEDEKMELLRKRLQKYEEFIRSLTADDENIKSVAPIKDAVSSGPDSGYFGSYSHLDIHEVMLKDKHRTNSYAAAIIENTDRIKGKIVLDVGCGSGILSMLAAKAGASLVIGIDVSDILTCTKVIVKRNGYDGVIKLIQGKLEECVHEIKLLLPKDGKVDVIVSEWMVMCDIHIMLCLMK